MKKSVYFPTALLLFLIFAGMLHWGCEKKEDPDGEWPAEIELTEVDYIGSGEAYFTADLAGTIIDITENGFCWGKNNPPVTDDNKISFSPSPGIYSHTATGLANGTDYYMRAYYVYDDEIYYGQTVPFTSTTPITDTDGNEYETVQIGQNIWMAENLRVVTYQNGDSITDGTGRGNYSGMASPKFYFNYDDEAANSSIYGKLYTWYVITDERGVCPSSWRVPDITDLENMIKHLDALALSYEMPATGSMELSAIAGGMLRTKGTREAQTGLWYHPNAGATNITRMNLVPSGLRDPSGAFDGLGYNAALWSFTEETNNEAIMFYTHYFNPGIYANTFLKSSGYAVRCVRNAP